MWNPAKYLSDYLFQNDSGIILTKYVTKKKTELGHFWLDNTYLAAAGIVSWCKSKPQDPIIKDEWQMCPVSPL